MKGRVLKKNDKCYIELPAEFMTSGEVELFRLRDGYYLLSLPLGQAEAVAERVWATGAQPEAYAAAQGTQAGKAPERKTESNALNDAERAVLKKLMDIKFEQRTPDNVAKAFNAEEKRILAELEKKGYINVFKGKKYSGGVYNIRDSVYPLLKGHAEATASPQEKAEAHGVVGELFKKGYAVLMNDFEAGRISDEIKNAGKSKEVFGIKSFDGKYYIVTKPYLDALSAKIQNIMKGDMDPASVAKACKAEEAGCRAVLLLMAEQGEAVEKKKGMYALI